MSNPHETTPSISPEPLGPEQQARMHVVKIGKELIDLAHGKHQFEFADGWVGKAIHGSDDTPFDGALYERNRLAYGELDHVRLLRLDDNAMSIKLKQSRPNINTHTTADAEYYVSTETDINRANIRWSDPMPETVTTGSIFALKDVLTDLQLLTSVPAQRRGKFWSRLFHRAAQHS